MSYQHCEVKFDGGQGALLCTGCRVIIASGFHHEDRAHYCERCGGEPYQYTPDHWIILKIAESWGVIYRLLAGWNERKAGDKGAWRLNSGIASMHRDGNDWIVTSESGSEYRCPCDHYGSNDLMVAVYTPWLDKNPNDIEILPNQDDWSTLIKAENKEINHD